MASVIPASSSGILNVALSLATAMSAIIAIKRPPAWQIPFTAAMTGAYESRMARKGRTSGTGIHVEAAARAGTPATQVASRSEHVAGTGDDQCGEVTIGVDDRAPLV